MKISEMKRLLKKNGCYFTKQDTRHELWYSPITKQHFLVPRHNSHELKTGMAEAIKKEAGLK